MNIEFPDTTSMAELQTMLAGQYRLRWRNAGELVALPVETDETDRRSWERRHKKGVQTPWPLSRWWFPERRNGKDRRK